MDKLSSRFSSHLADFVAKMQGRTRVKYDNGGGPWNPERDEPEPSPLVAMDFTGRRGRIIDNPREAEAVAAAKVRVCKWIPPRSRSPQRQCLSAVVPTGDPQCTEPWFYGSLPREMAEQLLLESASEDGTFLVRESQTQPAAFVLCYLVRSGVRHVRILSLEGDAPCFSIDSGQTSFSSLEQLVQFYQQNKGHLLIRLGQCLNTGNIPNNRVY